MILNYGYVVLQRPISQSILMLFLGFLVNFSYYQSLPTLHPLPAVAAMPSSHFYEGETAEAPELTSEGSRYVVLGSQRSAKISINWETFHPPAQLMGLLKASTWAPICGGWPSPMTRQNVGSACLPLFHHLSHWLLQEPVGSIDRIGAWEIRARHCISPYSVQYLYTCNLISFSKHL